MPWPPDYLQKLGHTIRLALDKFIYIYILKQKNRTPPIKKKLTHIVYSTYQQTWLAKMSIDPKFVELTAEVLKAFL